MKSFKIPCVGYQIAADWYDGAAGNNNVLLVLVGYTSSKKRYEELVKAIVKKSGYSALVVDYTGHGESPYKIEELSPAQNFLEVITSYDWLANNHPEKTISVMGTSYGGFMAIQLTKYRTPKKLVLRVPAIYSPETFYTKWKDMDLEWIRQIYRTNSQNFVNHPLLKRASNFSGEAYVLTHEFDEACPKPTTDAITQAFHAKTWDAKGFKHALSESAYTNEQFEEYQNKIVEWLA